MNLILSNEANILFLELEEIMRYNKLQMEKWNSPQTIAIYTAMFLYISACLLPCLETKSDVIYGWHCLAFGRLSLLSDFKLILYMD